jgi:P27 family predicted phage terminase small subunit
MSRPRKPDELHVLEGTFRADRHGDPAVSVVADGQPTPPAHLRGDALAFWGEVVPGLVAAGVAKERDAAELAMMCEWWARYRRFSRLLDKMKNADKRLYQVTVQVGIAWTNFDRIACRFGLTPADRAKLRSTDKPAKSRVASRKRGG